MKRERALNWILYNGALKPTEGISDARWRAMVARLVREELMSFMQKDVYHGAYYRVETTVGTEVVPFDVAGDVDCVDDLRHYLEGDPDSEFSWEAAEGWLARMSAPGYLDCTAWGAYETEREAHDALDEMYGDSD